MQSKPDALIIAGNDPNAIAPALKQAAQKGVKVVSMDSDVAPDVRNVSINQVTTATGRPGTRSSRSLHQMATRARLAILSATANATNQNAWTEVMKETLKDLKYKDMSC